MLLYIQTYQHKNSKKVTDLSFVEGCMSQFTNDVCQHFHTFYPSNVSRTMANKWPSPHQKKNRKIFQYKFMHNHWILGVADVHKSYRKKSRSHSNSWIIPCILLLWMWTLFRNSMEFTFPGVSVSAVQGRTIRVLRVAWNPARVLRQSSY